MAAHARFEDKTPSLLFRACRRVFTLGAADLSGAATASPTSVLNGLEEATATPICLSPGRLPSLPKSVVFTLPA
jgi:hypothetical protein